MEGMRELWSNSGWGGGANTCQLWSVLASLLLQILSSVLRTEAPLPCPPPGLLFRLEDFGLLHGLWTWFNPLVLVAQQPMVFLPQPQVLSSYSCFRPKEEESDYSFLCVCHFF